MRKENGDEERVAGVALEVESFAVVGLYVFKIEVLVELDADAAGNFGGDEIDFGDGGDGLAAGFDGGGDVVVRGEEGGAARGLGVRCVGAQCQREHHERHNDTEFFETNGAGHRTPFRLLAKGTSVIKPGLFYLTRIAEGVVGVASGEVV